MNIKIRGWKLEDANNLAVAVNNPKILENLRDGLPFPYTVKDAEEFIESMLNSEKDKVYAFAITADDKVIGGIGVFRKDNIHFRTAEMGYYIAEPFWNKGIGTVAVVKTSRYIFENTDIIRIFAEPFARNIASCRILEKAGFVYEGTLRKNAIKNGIVVDMKMYALTKETL